MNGEAITLQIPGLELAGLAWGPPEGRKVLAIHGWLDNAASFSRLAPLLPDLRVVALDLPGHGQSAHRPPGVGYHFVDWVVDVVAAADALGWERFALLGHSMGAAIASLVAGTVPERVTRLVMIEGLGPLATPVEEAPARLARCITKRAALEKKRPRSHADQATAAERLRQVVPSLGAEAARILIERGVREVPDGGVTWRSDPRLRGFSPMRLCEEHVLAFLRQVLCPSLLIRALEGFPFDLKMMAGRVSALASSAGGLGCRVEELQGGHHLHLDDPEQVAALVGPFFNSPSDSGSAPPVQLSKVGITLDELQALKGIKLLVLDVDGVLTPGHLNYGAAATDRYVFDVKDGLGIKMLQRNGVEVALLSGRSSDPVQARARDLKIEHALLGIKDKLPRLKKLLAELGLELHQVAYMGDDLNDLPVLRKVGFPAAPADARPEALRLARFVSGRPGGRGAVRELAEQILKFQGRWREAVGYYDPEG